MLSEDKFYDKTRLLNRLKAKTKYTKDGHWLWWGKTRFDYGVIQCGGKYTPKYYSTSRISAFIHLNLDLNNTTQHALHKNSCPYKTCWNPDCLYVGNHSNNMRDMAISNTHCRAGHDQSIYGGAKSNGKNKFANYCKECHRLRSLERSETHYPNTKLE